MELARMLPGLCDINIFYTVGTNESTVLYKISGVKWFLSFTFLFKVVQIREFTEQLNVIQISFKNMSNSDFPPLQSIVAPNGLIAHLFGPVEGKRHDAFMLGISGLYPHLSRIIKPNGNLYVVYGDPAYVICQHILSPFRGANLTQLQQQFNRDIHE